jgi:hypothetical protein
MSFAAGDWNLYRYVGNNSINNLDSSGMLSAYPGSIFGGGGLGAMGAAMNEGGQVVIGGSDSGLAGGVFGFAGIETNNLTLLGVVANDSSGWQGGVIYSFGNSMVQFGGEKMYNFSTGTTTDNPIAIAGDHFGGFATNDETGGFGSTEIDGITLGGGAYAKTNFWYNNAISSIGNFFSNIVKGVGGLFTGASSNGGIRSAQSVSIGSGDLSGNYSYNGEVYTFVPDGKGGYNVYDAGPSSGGYSGYANGPTPSDVDAMWGSGPPQLPIHGKLQNP